MTKTIILDFLRSHKDEMYKKFALVKIGLLESYVRGEQRDDSDIDLAIEIENSNKFRSFFGLKAYLEDALHKKIDIGIESSIKPIVKKYIEKEIEYA